MTRIPKDFKELLKLLNSKNKKAIGSHKDLNDVEKLP
jgi:hypothetical protein